MAILFMDQCVDDLQSNAVCNQLTHWGRATHICVGKLTIIGSENGLSPSWCQAIIWTSDGLLSIGPLRKYFNEVLIKTQQFSMKKMHLKMSSEKQRLCCLGPNVLRPCKRASWVFNPIVAVLSGQIPIQDIGVGLCSKINTPSWQQFVPGYAGLYKDFSFVKIE